MKQIQVPDVTLRDAHQSLIATRMATVAVVTWNVTQHTIANAVTWSESFGISSLCG